MADLKLNEELPFINPSSVKIKNIKGNVRFVGYGKTDSYSISSNTWTIRNFNTTCTTYDTHYLTVSGGNRLKVEKAGLYMFVWHQRAHDSSTSQYAGVAISSEADNFDSELGCWGGGVYRNTLHGNWIKYLNVGETIYVRNYYDSGALSGVTNGAAHIGSVLSTYVVKAIVEKTEWNVLFIILCACAAFVAVISAAVFITFRKKPEYSRFRRWSLWKSYTQKTGWRFVLSFCW